MKSLEVGSGTRARSVAVTSIVFALGATLLLGGSVQAQTFNIVSSSRDAPRVAARDMDEGVVMGIDVDRSTITIDEIVLRVGPEARLRDTEGMPLKLAELAEIGEGRDVLYRLRGESKGGWRELVVLELLEAAAE